MNKDGKPGSADVPAGLDNLDDIEPSSTPTGSAGNAAGSLGGEETLRRLLDDDAASRKREETRGLHRRIQPNAGGLKKGYDPYDSGMLQKKQWKKKKDLRALSQWIEQKKKVDEGR